MNSQELGDMIIRTTLDVKEARLAEFAAAENMIVAKIGLQAAENAALLLGKVDGKNAEIRNAQLADICKEQIRVVLEAEAAYRRAKFSLEQFETTLGMAHKLLTLMVVEVKTSGTPEVKHDLL